MKITSKKLKETNMYLMYIRYLTINDTVLNLTKQQRRLFFSTISKDDFSANTFLPSIGLCVGDIATWLTIIN